MMLWLLAFVLTLGCELPLVACCAPSGWRRRAALDSLAINACTHPLAWLAVNEAYLPWLVVEVLVLVAEALAYRHVTQLAWPRAIAAAALANVVTASMSFLF